MNLQLEKKNIPHGILTAIAKKVKKTTYQSVGVVLGIYPPTMVGVTPKKKEIILKAAKEVAQEKIKEYEDFLSCLS
jgi:hypothetical protein